MRCNFKVDFKAKVLLKSGFKELLLCRGLRPNRTCRIGRGRPLPTP